jgi:hypothetical protein
MKLFLLCEAAMRALMWNIQKENKNSLAVIKAFSVFKLHLKLKSFES